MRVARRAFAAFSLTAPSYIWLTVTVFLPLLVMLYFSFLSTMPYGHAAPALTFKQYASFFEKGFYRFLAWRSIKLGLTVTACCVLIGYPAALILARSVRGAWREAVLLLIV